MTKDDFIDYLKLIANQINSYNENSTQLRFGQ